MQTYIFTQMHSFTSFVMRNQHWSIFRSFRINECLDSIGNRVEWMKYIEKSGTRWQYEVFTKHIDTSNCHKHTNRAAESEKGTWVKM